MKDIFNLRSYMVKLKRSMQLTLMLIILISFSTQAQERTLKGKVSSATTGETLPGVSVLIKGTARGTITNLDGEYSIVLAADSETLVFSFIGMKALEVAIGGRSAINIQMEDDVTSLEEIIVTGYSSESKKTVTGSIDALDAQKAFAIPSTSAAEGFQGRLSGVTVVSNGQPGEAPIVRIRGIATTGNNDPLYIIDGYQTQDPDFLTDLNTSDIESVTVLKDAAVASIYGARATNGVIVIKTRKGSYEKGGSPKISFDMSYGIQKPVTQPDMLNSQQLGEVFWASKNNDGNAPSHPQFGIGTTPNLSEYYRGDKNAPYTADNNRLTRTSEGTDWFGTIFDNARYQNYYLSVNGGSEASKYMMSLGYQENEGILTGTEFDRYSGRANTEFSIKDKVRVGQNLAFAYANQTLTPSVNSDENPIGSAYRASPLIPTHDEGGNFAGTYRAAAGLGNAQNPLAVMTRAANNTGKYLRMYGDAYAEVDIVDGLTARTNVGVTYGSGQADIWSPLNPEHSEASSVNALTTGYFRQTGYVWTNTLMYEKTIAENHNLSVIAGVEAIEETSEITLISQSDFLLNDDVDHRILGAGVGAVSANSSYTSSTLFSYFGKIGYNFQEKYLFSVTLRKDKTSRFLDGKNTGVFPAVSLGWVLSEEIFIPEFFSNLKIRGSYGEMGNQSIPNATPSLNVNNLNDQLSFYNFGGVYTPGTVVGSAGNPDLTWETSVQKNIGLNLGIMDDAIELDFDYFDLVSKDNLIAPSTPTTAPLAGTNGYRNIGEIKNKGFEMSLRYNNNSSGSAFKYSVGLKLSKYKNEIIETDGKGTSIVGGSLRGITFTNSQVGGSISSFYGKKVLGIFRTQAEVDAAATQDGAGVGRLQYADINNDGEIDDDDRIAMGDPNPDFTYGINIDLEYKGIDLSLFFTGSKGNKIYNYTKIFTDFSTFYNGNRSTRVLDAFHPDTNPNGNVPMLSETVLNGETQPNSYFVEDGSYARLKNLQIGYTLPASIIEKAGMSRCRIYVQASNLFTVTDYTGLDPEIGRLNNSDIDTGIDFGSYPTSQTYMAGLSIDF